ncbi:MAG: hypothetical protein JNK27_14120 [Chitinophagaceae bacterium]|nr:hypothetical protein [Chitinophagaceae bacterium]
MQKQHFLFAITVLISAAVVSGCDKNDDPPAKTKSELLVQASWKFQSASASGTDITNNAAITCIKDDVVTFTAAGGGTVTEGAIVCSPTTAGNFTWNFQDSETKLMMSAGLFPAGSGLFTIVTLNETTLTLSQDVTIPPSPVAIPVVATYVH